MLKMTQRSTIYFTEAQKKKGPSLAPSSLSNA